MRVLIGVLVLGCCAWQTRTRLEDWRSDEALWTAAVAVAERSPRARLNLAVALERRSAFDEARAAAQTAARLAVNQGDVDVAQRADRLLIWLAMAQDSSCASDSPC